MLKQSSGNGISNYPTHSVSPKLAKVLVKMTDNSFPTFDEVAELEDMDKKHLFKLCKECHLLNKVNLPKMTDYEKELHNFYVMLGELQCGNSNKGMMREFKHLLLKFIHEKIIPRREGMEILEEIVALGV